MTGQFSFLTLDDVLLIHALAIEDQGGDPGIRDRGLLESAMAQPRQSFSGQPVHTTIEEIAAAYLFFICRNHPFIDGNKRAGFGAMVGCLAINRFSLHATTDESVELVLGVASGNIDRSGIIAWLKGRIQTRVSDQP